MNLTRIIDIKERIAISEEWSVEECDFILDCINKAIEGARPPAPTALHDPGNYLGRIDQIWAFLSLDDGGEGVVAAPFGNITAPLIAADKRRLDSLIPIAKQLAGIFGKPVRLAKFTKREDVEIYQP